MFRALLCFCGGGQWAHGHVGASQSGLGLPPLPSLPAMASASTPLPAMLPLLGIIQPRGPSHSGVASVLGRRPADRAAGGGTVLSHAATADPSTQTLGTPPTGPSLPPLMYSSLPGCLAMEPRLPDLASVSLGEGWGAGLLEPLRRERLASGWVAVDSIRTLGWSEGWAPQPAGASSPLGDCSDRGATGKARLRGL